MYWTTSEYWGGIALAIAVIFSLGASCGVGAYWLASRFDVDVSVAVEQPHPAP